MELLAGIETRKSYRAFKPTPVPREIIEQVLEVAGKSPSYANSQPWEVAVVSGERKEGLSKILYKMAEADVEAKPDLALPKGWPPELEKRVKEQGAKRFKALGIEREDHEKRREARLQNFRFYGAPCALFLFMDSALTSWSVFDMGLFAQTLILAAHSFGLGSCLQASLTNYPDAVRDFLGIPKTKLLALGISLGYPDVDAAANAFRSSRAGLSEFVHWHV